ncbi:hypothetical protein ACFOLF_12245 [Paenibacillus sepulcri]|uniref:Uncharacterized protein n=1 Tax=Paenibacillus sepulcri TaxID=359917 RepID=A0ABS7BUW0_9BACL|nr:hypothetical protein [Paenibacillus sepulcri]
MMRFRFTGIVRKYEVLYTLIRHGEGVYNSEGVYQRPEPELIALRGVIQPMGARWLQTDGGKYTEDDRLLFTVRRHENGDSIMYNGHQYTVHDGDDRSDYSDTYEYRLKRVSTHDPIPGNP